MKQTHKESKLEVAYEAASKDKDREAEAKEWSTIDNANIEGWEWD